MKDLVILTPHVILKTPQKLVSLQHLQVEAIHSSHITAPISLHFIQANVPIYLTDKHKLRPKIDRSESPHQ